MSTVTVLMSTYNGQQYLREQMDSLLSQEEVSVKIVIRDDGSKDLTIDILSEYSSRYSNVIILEGENCGAEESYNRLCRYAKENIASDYYAFCDQDDVWDKDKLQVAVKQLNERDLRKPLLYFSNLKMVDDRLRFIRDFYEREEVNTGKSKTLVQIFTYGCTCVFNAKALDYYCRVEPQQSYHDHWIYCICSFLGEVIYDPIGHVLYRQHDNNLSGHRSTGIPLLISRIKRPFLGNLGNSFEILAKQLLLFSEELGSTDLQLISKVADYRKNIFTRLRLLFSSDYRTGDLVKDICIKYRILCSCL